jgi:uncharacterized protein YhaN
MHITSIHLKNVGKFKEFSLKNLQKQLYSIESSENKSNGVGKTTLIRAMVYGISNDFPEGAKNALINVNAQKAEIEIEFNNSVKVKNIRSRNAGPVYELYEFNKSKEIRQIKDLLEYAETKYGFKELYRYCYYRKITELPPHQRVKMITDCFFYIDFDRIYGIIINKINELKERLSVLEKSQYHTEQIQNKISEHKSKLNSLQQKLNGSLSAVKNQPLTLFSSVNKWILENFENLKTCPACGAEIDSQKLKHMEKHYEKLKEQIEILKEIEKITQELQSLNALINSPADSKELEKLQKELNTYSIFKDYFIVWTSSTFRQSLLESVLSIVNPLVNDMLSQFVDFRVDLLPSGELAINRVLSKGEEHVFNIVLFLNLYLLYRSKHTIPSVLFIDEFIENLDMHNTEKMLDLIKAFSKDVQIFLTTPRPLPLTENNKIIIEA